MRVSDSDWRAGKIPQLVLVGGSLLLALFILYRFSLPYMVAAIIGFAGLLIALVVLAKAMSGNGDMVGLTWVIFYPLGYYFGAFPREHSIINWDRLCFAVLILALLCSKKARIRSLPRNVRTAGLLWIGFLLVASIMLVLTWDGELGRLRCLLDAFLLPAIPALWVIALLDVRRNAAKLHLIISVLSIYVAAISIAEVILQEDLLPLSDPSIGTGMVFRATGPFIISSTLAIVGAIAVVLLFFLRQAVAPNMRPWQRILHVLGVTGGLIMVVAPLGRGGILALGMIGCMELFARKTGGARGRWIMLVAPVLVAVIGVRFLPSEIYEDRVSNADNLYQRIAQTQQNWKVFLDHPLYGVGLGNFSKSVSSTGTYTTWFQGVESMGVPHSNLGGILSETGVVGIVCYLGAQLVLLVTLWKLARGKGERARDAAKCMLYIFIIYTVNGLDVAVGYYAEANVWYMFALAVCAKFVCAESSAPVTAFSSARRWMLAGAGHGTRAVAGTGFRSRSAPDSAHGFSDPMQVK